MDYVCIWGWVLEWSQVICDAHCYWGIGLNGIELDRIALVFWRRGCFSVRLALTLLCWRELSMFMPNRKIKLILKHILDIKNYIIVKMVTLWVEFVERTSCLKWKIGRGGAGIVLVCRSSTKMAGKRTLSPGLTGLYRKRTSSDVRTDGWVAGWAAIASGSRETIIIHEITINLLKTLFFYSLLIQNSQILFIFLPLAQAEGPFFHIIIYFLFLFSSVCFIIFYLI